MVLGPLYIKSAPTRVLDTRQHIQWLACVHLMNCRSVPAMCTTGAVQVGQMQAGVAPGADVEDGHPPPK